MTEVTKLMHIRYLLSELNHYKRFIPW